MPTVGESVPGYEAILWYACWGPKGLPKDIVMRWNREIAKAISTPEMRERMAGEGLEPAGGPPEQFRDVLRRDVPKWIRVVKEANVQVDTVNVNVRAKTPLKQEHSQAGVTNLC